MPHQLFKSSHLTIPAHPRDRRHAAAFHVEGKEILLGHVAPKDDLVPACGVADVEESGVELPRPEERHAVICDLLP